MVKKVRMYTGHEPIIDGKQFKASGGFKTKREAINYAKKLRKGYLYRIREVRTESTPPGFIVFTRWPYRN